MKIVWTVLVEFLGLAFFLASLLSMLYILPTEW